MEIYRYGETEIAHLKAQDRVLGQAIERIGRVESPVIPDLFAALVNSIVAQQISSKAAETVWRRMLERFQPLTAQALAGVPVEQIQQCGLSMRKAGYIHSTAQAALRGELEMAELAALDDEQVIRRLSTLPGIGVWTAEMLLIFALQRPDVVSWGDLGIRRGMMRLYGHETLDKTLFAAYRKRYSPFGTVASLYLWEIAVED